MAMLCFVKTISFLENVPKILHPNSGSGLPFLQKDQLFLKVNALYKKLRPWAYNFRKTSANLESDKIKKCVGDTLDHYLRIFNPEFGVSCATSRMAAEILQNIFTKCGDAGLRKWVFSFVNLVQAEMHCKDKQIRNETGC